MIIGILLGLSISVFLFSGIILILGKTNSITGAVVGSSNQLFYPVLALIISLVMIGLAILAIAKRHSD